MQTSFDFTSNYHRGNHYSILAYDSIKEQKLALRNKIALHIYNKGLMGCTSDEVEQALQIPHTTVSARITELKALQVVQDSGRSRKTRQGRAASVVIHRGLVT